MPTRSRLRADHTTGVVSAITSVDNAVELTRTVAKKDLTITFCFTFNVPFENLFWTHVSRCGSIRFTAEQSSACLHARVD
jgi:hypothetical protein